MDALWKFTKSFRFLFYAVHPDEHAIKDIGEITSYTKHALPAILFIINLEQFLLWISRKKIRINDVISSSSQGLLYEFSRIWTIGVEVLVYSWLYDRYHLVSISAYTWSNWIACAVAVDFGYYWIHRLMHEVHIFWAVHQVHHSSEEYNMTTAIRMPILRPFLEWLTCLLLALVVPPPMFFVHYELQLLMQAWVHFGIIGKLGYVDYVINSPSNHRVHHGRNRRCIDKNFGGVLMIWDHLFGTYENEGDSKINFGLVHPLQTFNPAHIQFHTFTHIWRRLFEVPGFANKLSVLFKGPAWDIGKPRLGYIDEVTEEPTDPKFDPEIGAGRLAYVVVHFWAVLLMFFVMFTHQKEMSNGNLLLCGVFLVHSTFTFGYLLEGRVTGLWLELLRCIFYLLAYPHLPFSLWTSLYDVTYLDDVIRIGFALSAGHMSFCFVLQNLWKIFKLIP